MFDGGCAIAQATKMWNSRHLLAALPTIIATVLYSPEARPDALQDLVRDVCYKVHDADAQSIRKYEEENLFATLRVLKARAEQKRLVAKQKEEEYKLELKKAEDIKLDIQRLEYLQQYNRILRTYAIPINQKSLQIAELESAFEKEDDENKKQDFRRQIDQLKAEIGKLTTEAHEILPLGFGTEMRARFGTVGDIETAGRGGGDTKWAVIPELTQKLEPKIQAELARTQASLPEAEREAAPYKQAFVTALVELKESMKLLGFMERVIRETDGCRSDAKRDAPRRDLIANFKINCRSPEFDYPVCGHGSMWINFDAQGRTTGQAGFSRVCATDTQKQKCLDVPAAQVTGATGQIAGNTLTATVTYMLPSNKPRKDTGDFRFEGRVTPDGNVMPIAWRGAGSVTSAENKFPYPPNKPYVVTCSGQWTTESVPACWDE